MIWFSWGWIVGKFQRKKEIADKNREAVFIHGAAINYLSGTFESMFYLYVGEFVNGIASDVTMTILPIVYSIEIALLVAWIVGTFIKIGKSVE